MACPRAKSGRHKDRINKLLARPWTHTARASRVLRRHLDAHGYITPHFRWSDMADTRGPAVPKHLRGNAIRHCWNLERLRHRLGGVPIVIDGPYRTYQHNREIGGAYNSRHTYADASDHFLAQVERWTRQSLKVRSRGDVVNMASRVFAKGGVGNETSGTLHLDSRGYRARFVTWTAAR